MSATELIMEKARGLTEPEALSVLDFIDRLKGRALKPTELMKLPREVRNLLVTDWFAGADEFYQKNPDLIIDDKEGPIGHD
jgi:hypothetical protein